MAPTKADLLDRAYELGLDVDEDNTKAEIQDALDAADDTTAGDSDRAPSRRHKHNHGTLVAFERDDVITGAKLAGTGIVVELVDGGGYGIAALSPSVYVEADGVSTID